jgi:hypothetical protein
LWHIRKKQILLDGTGKHLNKSQEVQKLISTNIVFHTSSNPRITIINQKVFEASTYSVAVKIIKEELAPQNTTIAQIFNAQRDIIGAGSHIASPSFSSEIKYNTHKKQSMAKKIAIGILISVVGGLIVWYVSEKMKGKF